MERRTRAVPVAPAGRHAGFSPVHDVVGPLIDSPAPLGLYAHGAQAGPTVATGTGTRSALVVPAGGTADFGSYFNAFPASQWRTHAGIGTVRLRIAVGAPAVLTVHVSDPDGASAVVEQRLLRAEAAEAVDVPLGDGPLGLLWFRLQAGARPVTLLEAAWQVQGDPRSGRVVVGSPTTGRAADVADNLRRILAAPSLAALVERVVVVDHAPAPIEPALHQALGGAVDPRLVVHRQANLGGSGGYSRLMHEASGTAGAAFALLLDDDVRVEPAALLRAIEFGRRTSGQEIVGLQMLDALRPSVLEAGAEGIDDRTFWWAPVDARLPGIDVAARPVGEVPALHRMDRADFAGWWGALIPLEVVQAIGYAMPFFLKWDDAEYALRARRAGFRTVSLQGAAVWHESWRIKDDARTWPAFFHARNRLLAALLHGSARVRTGVLLSGLMVEVKQLLALQTFAVERRQEGLRAVLAGPTALADAVDADFTRLIGLAATAPDQQRVPNGAVDPSVPAATPRALAPVLAPRGLGLALWAGLLVVRHLLAPVRARGATRLPAGRGTWWVLPSFDDVFAPTADGEAYFRLQRDRSRFRTLLASSVRLHVRLWLRWPVLSRRYRGAEQRLASPAAWQRRFDAADGGGRP